MATKPKKLDIRTYNVGFGDCFLLSFDYGKESKHVLIDFGSTAPPESIDDFQVAVANDIAEVTGGELHAVVATHRHKDHISGFATSKGKGSGDIIRKLADKGEAVIIQPWTEDPEAPTDATGPRKGVTSRKAFVQQLDNMHRFAESVLIEAKRMKPADLDADPPDPAPKTGTPAAARAAGDRTMGGDDDDGDEARLEPANLDMAGTTASKRLTNKLAFIGEDNVKNLSAVKNLMAMGKTHEYAFFGATKVKSALEKILPGVKVHLLGPPTIDQYDKIQKQRSRDPNEFWQLRQKFWGMQAANVERTVGGRVKPLFPKAKTIPPGKQPRQSRWFVRRLRGARAKQLLELVLIMDEAMNNTSVILLFEVGGKKLLFPGDAQIENWEFALGQEKILKLLAEVDYYKVGHHGSLNATPKTLWHNFAKKSEDENDADRLTSLISTKAGKHGSTDRNTEVPRRTLVAALQKESNLVTTQKLRKQLIVLTEVPL